MTRDDAIAGASAYYDSGRFRADLERRVAYRTETADDSRRSDILAYFSQELTPLAERLGATAAVHDNPVPGGGPVFVASRIEDPARPTVLTYGHADVVAAEPGRWRDGLDPWRVTVEGDRWYGRGTADNKGQHTINLAALAEVLRARGSRLGFNLTILIESGEESGSRGLREFCRQHADELGADVLIASDGTRVAAERPTVFLGSRGSAPFTLRVNLRDRSYHSGNWGGLLRNPATVLAHAIASLVDDRGQIRVPALRHPSVPDPVREALRVIPVGGGPDDPAVDEDWGEAGLTSAERVIAGNTLEVLSLAAGNPGRPVNAIPGTAHAHCQLRYVPGTDVAGLTAALREHLDAAGLGLVEVTAGQVMGASRTALDDPWVAFAMRSLTATGTRAGDGTGAGDGIGAAPVLLPNLGGSLPNDVFTDTLGLPTVWIPHSYPACAQHAPDEHLLGSLARESLRLMTGLFWDLGETGGPVRGATGRSA
jgi:acetylornithine deacetylase/succinyl-diaminopimelate desuccinylase-like protein